MAATSCKDFSNRLALTQKRLKEERLFIRQEKDLIRSLNENVSKESKELFRLSWTTQQHWKNLDRLVLGSRVFPSECSNTAKYIECVPFEDGSKCLGYQEMRYGEFLNKLRESPKLVAYLLAYADEHLKIDTTLLVRLLLSSVYGSCLFKDEEKLVLTVLNFLIEEQVVTSDDPLRFFCNPKSNAFSVVLKLFTSLLFSAKLYQTAALHGAVMQVIVEDTIYLELEVNKMLSRFPPKAIRHKFGEPGTTKANKKISEFMDTLQGFLVTLCKKFLRSLREKIYCFPPNLRWLMGKLFQGLVSKTSLEEKKVKAVIGHLLINYFVCPAILNPEPYGINTDATVTEIARYNLSQVACVLRALALDECGLKDPKMTKIIEKMEPGVITSYVESILKDSQDMEPLQEKETIRGINRTAILITERELKSLIFFLKKIQLDQDPKLSEIGLDEVLALLPALPRRWTKPKSQPRQAQSMPPLQGVMSPLGQSPGTSKTKRLTIGKKHNSMYGVMKDSSTGREEYANLGKVEEDGDTCPEDDLEHLMKNLASVVDEEESVLVITLGNVTGDEPGMLSEEKVLGLKNSIPTTATFDMERTDEDKRKRASTLLLGALKDLNEGFLGSQEDIEKLKSIVSKIDESESEIAGPDKDQTGEEIESQSTANGNLLIEFDSLNDSSFDTSKDSIADLETLNWQTTPVNVWGITSVNVNNNNNSMAKTDPLGVTVLESEISQVQIRSSTDSEGVNVANESSLASPFADNFCPTSSPRPGTGKEDLLSGTGNDLMNFGLNDGSKEKAEDSPTAFERTLSDFSKAMFASFDRSKRPSQQSVDSVLGGINTVLRGAGVQHSSNQLGNNSIDLPGIEEGADEAFEPRDPQRDRSVTENSSNSDQFPLGPWNDAPTAENNGSDVFGDEGTLSQSSTADDIKDMMVEAENIERSSTDATDVNSRRKKSSGLRFKDKIVSGFRQARSKSDGQHLKKETKRFQWRTAETLPTKREPAILEQGAEIIKVEEKTSEDISEDILQKYRRLTQTAGLMEDDDSFQRRDDEVESLIENEWDESFKFEDAKRKLRIVLCVADRSHFPCCTSSRTQLLMTFLQSQLAEAINLQDRSFVAQLHETIRSIRQLPSESCDKLLDALEEDYKQRSPYIAYLIRSKQHLLSALSHLEQQMKKLERDKNICSKYFTTVCVRLFLETPEKRREMSSFAVKFEGTNMMDEKCALVEEFLEHIYNEMSKDPAWISATDEQWYDCQMATERALMSIIYKDAFYPNGETDIENDRIFHDHIARLTKHVSVNHPALQIPKAYQKEAPWPSAQTELLMINAYKTPVDKLRCIHRCCVTIMNLLSMASDDSAPGADDFVPVLVYVVIKANPPNLLSTKQYVNNFYEKRLSGEEYYCWMQFCAAIEFIKSLR